MSADASPLPSGITVVGGGVMGRQIAALLASAGAEVDLLDLGTDEEPAALARAAIEQLPRMRPAPLFRPGDANRIRPGALSDAAPALARSSWIIEAVVEDLEIKSKVLDLIQQHAHPQATISTNTSGIPIASLTAGRSEDFCERFLGVHFFNPPRAMQLVEVIPGQQTAPQTLRQTRGWIEAGLGKRVVMCRDRPNFIANRLGVFCLMDALHRMIDFGLSVDAVDAVTGPLLGRPRSATLRLCDLIGLDTLAHVAGTAYDGLSQDDWRDRFLVPRPLQQMLEAGCLGAKSGAGFFRKHEGEIQSRNLLTGEYGARERVVTDLPTRGSLADRLGALWAAEGELARFAREHGAVSIAYALACAPEVADHIDDVDRALMWGFNWEAGPLAMADLIGAGRLVETLESCDEVVPELLARMAASDQTVYRHEAGEVIDPAGGYTAVAARDLADDATDLATMPVLRQVDGARLLDAGDGVGVLQFCSGALNILGPPALQLAIEAASEGMVKGLVLCGRGGNLSAGADLQFMLDIIDEQRWQDLEAYLCLFQTATSTMAVAPIPVAIAPQGIAVGGGCEFTLSTPIRVAAAELRIGLVESNVGLIPGAGGCNQIVRRVGAEVDTMFQLICAGRMSDNARQAQDWGVLDAADAVHMDGHRVIGYAIDAVRRRVGSWSPAESGEQVTAGAAGIDRLEAALADAAQKGTLSEHDVSVGQALAHVLCGGGQTRVTETRLLELERESFIRLCGTPETRERIAHMLKTGKPLRN